MEQSFGGRLTTIASEATTVQQTAVQWRLVLAAISAVVGILFCILGAVVSPVAFLVALPFVISAVLLGRQATTGMNTRRSQRRTARRSGGSDPRQRRRTAEQTRRQQGAADTVPPKRVTAAEARAVLDVPRAADEATVREAYRRRIKEVHPDQGGEEEEFRRVTAAYERLRDKDGEGGG